MTAKIVTKEGIALTGTEPLLSQGRGLVPFDDLEGANFIGTGIRSRRHFAPQQEADRARSADAPSQEHGDG